MSMKSSAATLALIGAFSAIGTTYAEDFDAGHFLQTKCTSCHDDGVYTRPDRRIQSLPALDAQVRRCDANLGTTLFDEDLKKVVDYLNTEYYGFKE